MTSWNDVKEMLTMLREDQSTPRSLREKILHMVTLIDSDKDTELKIDTLQQELEDVASDVNLPAFIRTQVWGLSSALETVE